MKNITIGDIVKATKGTLLQGDEATNIQHISIDSRVSLGNDIFIPIIGAKADAHNFISQAFDSGCIATLTSRKDNPEMSHYPGNSWIYVEDTIEALHEIGRLCRSRISVPAVGISGSVGKTTTREMVAAALSAEKKVFKTSKNYNSSVGVPITMSEMTEDDDIAVLELGMNVPGELGCIAEIAGIETAVLTNIGVAHMEFYGTQEAICHEKYTITKGFLPSDKRPKMIFINGNDPLLVEYKDSTGFPVTIFGTEENARYRAMNIHTENGKYAFDFYIDQKYQFPVVLSVLGEHNIINAVGALAVADYYHVDIKKAAEKLSEFSGFQNRLQQFVHDGYLIIDDTYNASPDSMKAGLDVLCSIDFPGESKKRIAVLGDMFELGENSKKFHYQVGEHGAKKHFDELLLIGEHAKEIGRAMEEHHGIAKVSYFQEKKDIVTYLKNCLHPGDVVYVKASNGMKLKEITKELMEA